MTTITYSDQLCEKILQDIEEGVPPAVSAAAEGLDVDTWNLWVNTVPGLQNRVATAEAKAEATATKKLFTRAQSGDRMAITFYLTERHGWGSKEKMYAVFLDKIVTCLDKELTPDEVNRVLTALKKIKL
jgi:hypothetical protein